MLSSGYMNDLRCSTNLSIEPFAARRVSAGGVSQNLLLLTYTSSSALRGTSFGIHSGTSEL